MIIVTGGSGKAGRACVRDLVEHGYDVLNVDHAPPKEDLGVPFIKTELRDYGQTVGALAQIDDRLNGVAAGVVHLAAIPAPGLSPNAAIFENNTLSTYNVFEASRVLGIKNVVWASSETVLGLPFDEPPPYVPADEQTPWRPASAYSLSKVLGEEMANQFCRWDSSMKIIGLRLSNVMEPGDYAAFPGFDDDARKRKWNLWGYIDARDAAQAMRLSLEAKITGAEVFVIANAETVMSQSNDALLTEVFPGVERRGDVGEHDTLLSIDKARRVLGYEPKHSWRDAK